MREISALEQALTCLYLAEASAGVSVGLINTFLGPKSPRCSQRQSDTWVRASRFCCAFIALVNAGFTPFPGTAGCWHCSACCRVPGDSPYHTRAPQMCPEFWEPEDRTVLANSIQWLCWICASAPPRVPGAQEGISPLDALAKKFSDRQEHEVCNTGVGLEPFGKRGRAARSRCWGALVELRAFPLKKILSLSPIFLKGLERD